MNNELYNVSYRVLLEMRDDFYKSLLMYNVAVQYNKGSLREEWVDDGVECGYFITHVLCTCGITYTANFTLTDKGQLYFRFLLL